MRKKLRKEIQDLIRDGLRTSDLFTLKTVDGDSMQASIRDLFSYIFRYLDVQIKRAPEKNVELIKKKK